MERILWGLLAFVSAGIARRAIKLPRKCVSVPPVEVSIRETAHVSFESRWPKVERASPCAEEGFVDRGDAAYGNAEHWERVAGWL